MASSKATKVLGGIQVGAAVLLVAGILTFAGPCAPHEDGTAATCAQASWGLIGLGVMLAGAALAQLAVEVKAARLVCAALCLVLGILVVLMPGGILPLCMMETMHCQAVMKPFAQLIGAIVAILAAVSAVVALRSR